MARKKTKPAVESTFNMSVQGHSLSGEKRGGKWTFTCPSWPELATEYDGAESSAGIISAFMAKALAGAVKFRTLE